MPSTVATSTSSQATAAISGRLPLIASDGTAFDLFSDGTNLVFRTASSPYTSWSSSTTISSSFLTTDPLMLAIFNGSATDAISVVYRSSVAASGFHHVSLSKSGTTWTVGTDTDVDSGVGWGGGFPSNLAVDGSGRLWIVGGEFVSGIGRRHRAAYASAPFTSWTAVAAGSDNIPAQATYDNYGAYGLAGGFLCAFYGSGTTLYGRRIDTTQGTPGWSTEKAYATGLTNLMSGTPYVSFSGTASDGMIVGTNAGGQAPWAYHYNPSTDSVDSLTAIGSQSNDSFPAVCTDGTNFYFFRSAYAAANSSAIVYRKWTQSTTMWDSSDTTVSPSGTNQTWLSAHGSSNVLAVTWTQGTSSPFNVELSLIFLPGLPYPITGALTKGGAGATSVTGTVGISSNAGDAIGVWFVINSSASAYTVTDSQGNTYTIDVTPVGFGTGSSLGRMGFAMCLGSAHALVAGTDTITVSWTNSVTTYGFSAVGFPGVATASALDVHTGSDGQFTTAAAVNAASGSTGTTAQASEIAIGAVYWAYGNTGTPTYSNETSGYTLVGVINASGGNTQIRPAYQVLSATGTQSYGETSTGVGGSNSVWLAGVVTYKLAAAGTTTTQQTVPQSAALLATVGRSIPQGVALLQASVARSAPQTAALLQPGLARAVSQSSRLLATLGRTTPQSAAFLGTTGRMAPQSAALLQAGLARNAPQSAALTQTTARTVPQAGVLLQTMGEAVPQSAALLQGGILRAVPQTAVVLATQAETVMQSVALLTTTGRTVTQIAALAGVITTVQRAVPQSAALLATDSETIVQSAALLSAGLARTVAQAAGLLTTTGEVVVQSAAFISAGLACTVAQGGVLLQTSDRAVPQAGQLLSTNARAVAQRVLLSGQASAPIVVNGTLAAQAPYGGTLSATPLISGTITATT